MKHSYLHETLIKSTGGAWLGVLAARAVSKRVSTKRRHRKLRKMILNSVADQIMADIINSNHKKGS